MKTLSLIAQKGGTGKTTLSIHLAVRASLDGLNVLLLDLDPQASATAWWNRRSEPVPPLVQADGQDLASKLDTARQHGYELVVIDTAPHRCPEARTCAGLSDRVCMPTRPAIFDLDGIGVSTRLVSDIGAKAEIVRNGCPPPNRFGAARIVQEARQALGVYGAPIAEVAISQRVAFSHALIDGRSVSELDRGGKAAGEIDRLGSGLKRAFRL